MVFCHVQTCDETKFNGESRDFHETVICSFSALFLAFVAARVVQQREKLKRKRGMSKLMGFCNLKK